MCVSDDSLLAGPLWCEFRRARGRVMLIFCCLAHGFNSFSLFLKSWCVFAVICMGFKAVSLLFVALCMGFKSFSSGKP